MHLTKNFTDDEFKCPCCREFVDSLPFRAFLAKLQDARNLAGIPFAITSGYRCEEHNAAVGGKEDSSHMKGVAADIRVRTSSERFVILNGLMKAGFTRLGIGKDFIHVDLDSDKPQHVAWVY